MKFKKYALKCEYIPVCVNKYIINMYMSVSVCVYKYDGLSICSVTLRLALLVFQ